MTDKCLLIRREWSDWWTEAINSQKMQHQLFTMTPLTTVELNRALLSNSVTREQFVGTFPSCITPITRKTKFSFITNIDEHDEIGQHWNAWFADGVKISFFDSFGRAFDDETLPEHYTNIVEEFDRVEYTEKRVQGWESVACGHFCTHFIYTLSLGHDYDSFLNYYSKNFKENDEIVADFYYSIS